jgi:hypothetical protein
LLISNRLLTVFPLSAFFSLFHLIIDNPQHFETQDNLTFLDVAAGYFRRLEYTMKQEFPFSIFPKLAAVAQEFVLKLPQQVGVTSSAAEVENLSLPDGPPVPGAGLDLQSTSELDISNAHVVPIQDPSDFGDPLYGINANTAFDQLPLAVEGTGYQADGVQFNPENEEMGFFGNLLDQTYNSLYGVDINWQ